MDTETLEKAKKQYENHLKHMQEYRRRNHDKMRAYSKSYYDKLKTEQPDKYKAMLDKKKEKYLEKKTSIFLKNMVEN